jgi:hypothetical protein
VNFFNFKVCLTNAPFIVEFCSGQYRRPPFKLAFHLILVILTTVHVVHLSQTIMPYMRNNLQTWNDLLAPPDAVTANNMGATQQYLICASLIVSFELLIVL